MSHKQQIKAAANRLINIEAQVLQYISTLKIQNMQITDLDGKTINITDLSKAIDQADSFRHSSYTNADFQQLDKKLQQYWEDTYAKLIQLKTAIDKRNQTL